MAFESDPPVSWIELKWKWQLISSSVNAVDSEVRGPATGVPQCRGAACWVQQADRHSLSSLRQEAAPLPPHRQHR